MDAGAAAEANLQNAAGDDTRVGHQVYHSAADVFGLQPWLRYRIGSHHPAQSVALEVAKEGITVNVICPTTTQTPMVQPAGGDDIPDDRAMRRSDRAVEVMARRAPWILRGIAHLAPATDRSSIRLATSAVKG